MKKLIKILLAITGILIPIGILAFIYLNFIYLPHKVKSEGPQFLQQKTKNQISAQSVRYIPLRGIELKQVQLLSKTREPILTIDKVYLDVKLLPLVISKNLDFRVDLYVPGMKDPFVFQGLYQITPKLLELTFKLRNEFFALSQPIYGTINASLNEIETRNIECEVTSTDLDLNARLFLEGQDLRIEQFSANILGSQISLIGDIQDLAQPLLNIYGNIDLDLEGLKKLNPKYARALAAVPLEGRLNGKLFISGKANAPELSLKMQSPRIKAQGIEMQNLVMTAELNNNLLTVSKCYARFCDGEINLEARVKLDSGSLPASLSFNIFNLELNKLLSGLTNKESIVHGRLFSLGRLQAPLQDIKQAQGRLWLSASGSNLLQIRALKGIAEVLRMPELNKIQFKEGSGNFVIANKQIATDDLKLTSNVVDIYYKGCLDFDGNLAVDIQPSFTQNFLNSDSSVANILGALLDSTGSFLGEIKLKGTLKEPRYTFKPISIEKIFPRGLEEGLKQLFNFKKK